MKYLYIIRVSYSTHNESIQYYLTDSIFYILYWLSFCLCVFCPRDVSENYRIYGKSHCAYIANGWGEYGYIYIQYTFYMDYGLPFFLLFIRFHSHPLTTPHFTHIQLTAGPPHTKGIVGHSVSSSPFISCVCVCMCVMCMCVYTCSFNIEMSIVLYVLPTRFVYVHCLF